MSDPGGTVTFVLLDAEDPKYGAVAATMASLRAQTVPAWDVVGAADGSVFAPTGASALETFSAGVAAAQGRFVAPVSAGDVVAPDFVARVLAASGPAADALVYADERAGGTVTSRPAWSPERLRQQNYIGRPWAATATTVRGVLELVEDGPAWEHDLLLAMTEGELEVVRLRGALGERPVPEPPSSEATAAVVARHLDRVGISATPVPTEHPGVVAVQRSLPATTTVSMVIPTGWGTAKPLDNAPADRFGRLPRPGDGPLVVNAVRELLAHTDHPAIEVVVVYDAPVPDGAIDALQEIAGDRLRLVFYDKPFNFSEKCNVGAVANHADVILLVNDDILPVTDGWLEALVAPLGEPGVAMTGAKLRFPDGRIQSGGHIYGGTPDLPQPGDAYRLFPADDPGPGDLLVVNREVSGVTGACLAIRRDAYEQVGGLAEELSHSYNDVDLCLKVRRAGHRIVWVAGCEMIHLESQTRNPTVRPWELEVLRTRWGGFDGDDYLT